MFFCHLKIKDILLRSRTAYRHMDVSCQFVVGRQSLCRFNGLLQRYCSFSPRIWGRKKMEKSISCYCKTKKVSSVIMLEEGGKDKALPGHFLVFFFVGPPPPSSQNHICSHFFRQFFPFMKKMFFCLVVRGVYPPPLLVVRPLKKTIFLCVSSLRFKGKTPCVR